MALIKCRECGRHVSVDDRPAIRVTPEHLVDRVLPVKAAELTGYTVKAIERKIETGVWVLAANGSKGPTAAD